MQHERKLLSQSEPGSKWATTTVEQFFWPPFGEGSKKPPPLQSLPDSILSCIERAPRIANAHLAPFASRIRTRKKQSTSAQRLGDESTDHLRLLPCE